MRTLYAIQFQVDPGQNKSITDCFHSLKNEVKDWIESKYKNLWKTSLEINRDGKYYTPIEGHTIRVKQDSLERSVLTTIDWTHPNDYEDSIFWQTSCIIASTDQAIEFALIIRISSASFIVKPINYKFGRPRIVTDILEKYNCHIDESIIPTKKIEVGVPDFDRFTNQILLNSKRVFPIVVVSTNDWTDEPIIEADTLQSRLLGFAQVAVLNKWSAFRLTNRFGKILSCYKGAIRLYWPGFTGNSNPWEHPLYLSDKIRFYEENGSLIDWHLFRILAGISAFRFSEGKITRKIRADIEAERLKQTENLRHQISEHTASLEEVYAALEQAWNENGQLRKERDESKERVDELEGEVESYKENLAALWEYQAQEEATEETVQELHEELELSNVWQALEKGEQKFADILIIWEDAKKSAKQSNFGRPIKVYEALNAIAVVGRRYFDKEKGKLIDGLDKAFEQRGFKYAAKESQNTINMYGKQRDFNNKGQKQRMQKHLTLGGGDRTNCIQIYFEFNSETKRVDIGYCGVHLDYYNKNT
jgi:hypothetical protein